MHLPMVQLLTSCAHVSEVAAIALVTGSGSGDGAGIVGSVMTAALGQSVGGEAGDIKFPFRERHCCLYRYLGLGFWQY